MLTTTLDAADTNPNTWQGFAAWFVADARIVRRFAGNWTASVGADNLLNRRYFLFHPFPQRTIFTHLKYDF
jgi:iron complex outermembrane receptor protein